MNIIRFIVATSFIAYLRFWPDHYARGCMFVVVFLLTGWDCIIIIALGQSLGPVYGFWLGILTSEADRIHREAAAQ